MIQREIEYHIRALIFAAFATLAIASWDYRRASGLAAQLAMVFALLWFAALSLLFWRGIDGSITELISQIKRLIERYSNGRHS